MPGDGQGVDDIRRFGALTRALQAAEAGSKGATDLSQPLDRDLGQQLLASGDGARRRRVVGGVRGRGFGVDAQRHRCQQQGMVLELAGGLHRGSRGQGKRGQDWRAEERSVVVLGCIFGVCICHGIGLGVGVALSPFRSRLFADCLG